MTFDGDEFLFKLFRRVERLKDRLPAGFHHELDEIMATGNQIIAAAVTALANQDAKIATDATTIATLQADAVDPATLATLAAVPAVAAVLNASTGAVTPAA